ncbi:serine/threonine-protein kinase [Nocardia harenae]|uniref:serine/threonine-protein kinase n=1 Tax=Nocardia harenae TaxID=358707 RepID=UPI00082C91B8|nr:serine/threonine-protein kinase [Nocardia harenae]
MTLTPGTVFAGHRIERALGAGGMGTVYLARHPRLPRSVALKVLDPVAGADPEFRARFRREAELAVQLDHPNIVEIYDRGTEDDLLWMSMRFVAGPDVAELIRTAGGRLDPRRAVQILTQAAAGLDSAHRRGLLHRDVKPANLLVADDDGADHVFVTDFGIARSRTDDSALTGAGALVATLGYVAPEQIRGDPLDHRADIYALGATLFQMLTGALPFTRSTPAAVLGAHLMEPPPRPSATVPGLPVGLDAVIGTAMAKDREQRFPDCRSFAAAARAALDAVAAQAVAPFAGGRIPAAAPGIVPAPSDPTLVRPQLDSPDAPDSVPSAPRAGNPDPAPSAPQFGGPDAPQPGGPGSVPPGFAPAAPHSADPSPPARAARADSRRLRSVLSSTWFRAAAAILAVLAIGTAATLAASPSTVTGIGTPAEPGTTTPTGAPPTTPPTTTRPTNPAWGRDADLVARFPGLLPPDPTATGYRGARCTSMNVLNNGGAPALECTQDDGVKYYVWSYRPDDPRRDTDFTTNIENATTREEPWTRPSGTGRVRWSHYPGANTGMLTVKFDDPARAWVVIDANWDFHTGDDLYRQWWPGLPL